MRKINNNVAVCRDGAGRELVAFGRGIGFPPAPYEVGLDKVERTFYDISPDYLGMMETLPGDVVEATSEIVAEARSALPYELSPNLLLTLSDHIAFAIKRTREGIYIRMPLAYDLEQTYPQEIALARRAAEVVKRRFKVPLPRDEASGIALAFVNARVYVPDEADVRARADDQSVLDEITHIVEAEMGVAIDRDSFNFARYATHVRYLLDRLRSGKGIDTINADIYAQLREEYQTTSHCVDRIAARLKNAYGFEMTDEERLYLILHVNRVCANEGS